MGNKVNLMKSNIEDLIIQNHDLFKHYQIEKGTMVLKEIQLSFSKFEEYIQNKNLKQQEKQQLKEV